MHFSSSDLGHCNLRAKGTKQDESTRETPLDKLIGWQGVLAEEDACRTQHHHAMLRERRHNGRMDVASHGFLPRTGSAVGAFHTRHCVAFEKTECRWPQGHQHADQATPGAKSVLQLIGYGRGSRWLKLGHGHHAARKEAQFGLGNVVLMSRLSPRTSSTAKSVSHHSLSNAAQRVTGVHRHVPLARAPGWRQSDLIVCLRSRWPVSLSVACAPCMAFRD